MTRITTMMMRVILLLLACSPAWAQQPAESKYKFDEFMLIEKVEDQEKVYNEMLKELPADKTTPAATNNHRAELAYGWLARGNVERYRHYKATNPKFNPRQLMYLCDALEKMTDVKRQYAEVEQISRELLDDLEKRTLSDGIGKSQVLMEVNAVSNAMLGNIDAAKAMMTKASEVKNGARDMKYFRDAKSSYLHRQALILSAAGEHQNAFDLLSKAFKDADSNPNMVATFKEIYSKVKGTDKGFEPYLESLRGEAYRKYHEEVEKTYIVAPQKTLEGFMSSPDGGDKKMTLFRARQPVHEISILNLEGKPVDLGAYKGQILALDFWSTGCTPCVAAFAGFERTVADYSKRDFQMFVVDLFETEDTVKAYVARKGITLDVLRDEENKAYDIQGTPTKIIFDSAGNIRFYAVGYAGSTDREYYKLKAMVEITRARHSRVATTGQ